MAVQEFERLFDVNVVDRERLGDRERGHNTVISVVCTTDP